MALDPDGHPPEALDRIRQDIGPSVFDMRYQQRPARAGPAQDLRGWPRYETQDAARAPRPTVQSWVLRVDDGTGEVTVTGACLAGEAVPEGVRKISVAMAAETAPVPHVVTRADVLALQPVERSPGRRLIAVTEARMPLVELDAYLQDARRRCPVENLIVEASGASRELLEASLHGRAHGPGLAQIEPAAARALLCDAIGANRLILPMAASWSGLVEDQLARLQTGAEPLSPTLLAIAQGLYLLGTGEAVVELSMHIGIAGDVAEEDDGLDEVPLESG